MYQHFQAAGVAASRCCNEILSVAEHRIPFLMTAVNVNAWEELMFGRNPCTQQFHTARLLFIRELNNLVNTVVNSVFPRPTLKLTFKELDDNDVQSASFSSTD